MRIIQIVPHLPNAICGVGDYAINLGQAIQQHYGVESTFVSTCPQMESIVVQSPFVQLSPKTGQSLVDALTSFYQPGRTAIVLQFSGYAFAYRGLCYWLVKGLRQFLERHRDVRLFTMFHEAWAPAPLYRLAGWVGLLQRDVARRLVCLSSAIWTSRVSYAEMLGSLNVQKPIPFQSELISSRQMHTQPISSNFGELQEVNHWQNCENQLLLLQPPSCDSSTGKEFWKAWDSLRARFRVSKTVVVGRTQKLPRDGIENLGILPSESISNLLRASRFVLVQYYDGCLAKSSIFAAIASHGALCIMPSINHSEADGVVHGEHYATPMDDQILAHPDEMQRLKVNLFQWYRRHSWEVTASQYMKVFRDFGMLT